ncbi:ATPase [Deinococcus cavernae]|uniref:ATPase n=1 Tax=Deinococcus cavernae TaxID=2320857 RepID=A0A418UZF8_9DEIO|nr:ATPase [Deinococcus cavernae]
MTVRKVNPEVNPGEPVLLGLDAGGSGTKWHLRRGDTTLGQGRAAPLTTLLLGTPQGQAALQELRDALPTRPDALHAGLPGLAHGSDRAAWAQGVLAQAFGLPTERVQVESDLDLAFRAHLEPASGGLLYAGTGSIAYGVLADGRVVRAGGRGYRIGDDGGGSSIGRAALRWLTDALDVGRVPGGVLAHELHAVMGGLDWDTVRAFVYESPGASTLAQLARPVSEAANQGDGAALEILRQAAQALADLAGRLRQQAGLPDWPIVATGGALQSQPLAVMLREALPGVQIQFRAHEAEASARAGDLFKP